MDPNSIRVGGRLIADGTDLARRYVGLAWSGGPPEVWAWRYYDVVPTDLDDEISTVDVLAAAALHPGLSRQDLSYFVERRQDLSAWLTAVPAGDRDDDGGGLRGADDGLLDHLGELVRLADDVQLTLLSKVVHRKRPAIVPLLDRHIIDRYRPLTGERRPSAAWRPVLQAIRGDLTDPESGPALVDLAVTVTEELRIQRDSPSTRLTTLRALDIAVWMEGR